MMADWDEISADELRARIAAGEQVGEDFTLLDVREPQEVAECAIEGSVRIPLGELLERVGELDTEKPTIVHCRSGVRSQRAIEALRMSGYQGKLTNLSGGIIAWLGSGEAACHI